MTIEEAYQTYGSKTYECSAGVSLLTLCRFIYKSDSDQYLNILRVLNLRLNWISVPAGTIIEYLDPSVVTENLY